MTFENKADTHVKEFLEKTMCRISMNFLIIFVLTPLATKGQVFFGDNSGGNQKRPSSEVFGSSDSNRNNKNDDINIGSILGLEDEKPSIVGRL